MKRRTLTFRQLAELWLQSIQNTAAVTTVNQYEHCLNRYILPVFDGTYITNITEDDVQALYNSLSNRDKVLSEQTIHMVATVLHECLRYAVNSNVLYYNPSELAYIRSRVYNRCEILTDEMIEYILKRKFRHIYENFFPFLLISAMRYGECAGLSWDCVDFNKNIVTIHQQLVEYNSEGKTIRTIRPCLKNYKTRSVLLPDRALYYLSEQKAMQNHFRSSSDIRWSNPDNLVFTNKDGSPYQHYKVIRRFKKIAELHGMPEATIHTLRHTGCSIIYLATRDIILLRQYTGHSSDGAASYYIHALESTDRGHDHAEPVHT